MNIKENLDKRICDCEQGAENTQTYREFIAEIEQELGLRYSDVDNMIEEEVREHLEWLDNICGK